jgi:hypothetical protein
LVVGGAIPFGIGAIALGRAAVLIDELDPADYGLATSPELEALYRDGAIYIALAVILVFAAAALSAIGMWRRFRKSV